MLDKNDVLWITGERYLSATPLHEHAAALKQQARVTWYADPSGATEIAELRAAGLEVMRGDNDIRLGIAAVTARIRTNRLVVSRSACPRLLAEARLYRYPTSSERTIAGEKPIDEHNHALGALRYLVSRLDARFIARLRKLTTGRDSAEDPGEEERTEHAGEEQQKNNNGSKENWLDRWNNEDLWRR